MAGENLLDRVEQQLERILEDPFLRAAPFDVRELKRRMVSAVADAGGARVPDLWYIRLPEGLRERNAEVRACIEALWRSLLASTHTASNQTSLTRPPIHLSYDADLTGDQMMVGYDFSPAAGIPPAPPTSPAAPGKQPSRQRRRHPVVSLARLLVVGALLGAVGLLALGPPALPATAAWRPALPALSLPSLPKVERPQFGFAQTRYLARLELHVRREPSTRSEVVGVVPLGERLRVAEHSVVRGESVRGEDRWVEVTPLLGYLKGERRYVWYGGLEPE